MSRYTDTEQCHRRGVAQYNMETLEAIARDLAKNPLTARKNTWESARLAAIQAELKLRRKLLK